MADSQKFYWLRMYDDLFTSKRIKKLRKLGADFFIIYLKMQLLSLKNNGVIEFTGLEESFAEELAIDIDEDSDKIQITMAYLQSCGLLVASDAEIFLPYVVECTGSETKGAARVRKHRERDREREKERVRDRERDKTQKRGVFPY